MKSREHISFVGDDQYAYICFPLEVKIYSIIMNVVCPENDGGRRHIHHVFLLSTR